MSLKRTLLAGAFIMGSSFSVRAADGAPAADLFSHTLSPSKSQPSAQPASGAPFVLEAIRPQAGQPSSQQARAKDIDISALRYYASQNDLARVSAEIRLLRSQHPNWEPPQDIFSDNRSTVDEQPLWDLFGKHDRAGLQAAIDDLHQKNPDWQPSNDLAQKIRLADAHDQLVAASDAQRWGDVVDIASGSSGLLTCGDVDALWRTAEALKQTGDEARAVEAYRYVLSTCDNPGERLATIQKATKTIESSAALDGLIALGRRGRDGHNEFESLKLDGLRAKIGDAAAGKPNAQVNPGDADQLASWFKTTHTASDAQLLGWYHYSRKEFADAETWFRSALAIKADPKSSEGLVLSLREEGKMPEALDLAMQGRELAPANRKVFVQVVSFLLTAPSSAVTLQPDQFDAFKAAVDTEKDAAGAQAYGWYLSKAKQVAQAEPWFSKSMDWQPSQDAAIGLMVTAKQLGHDQAYNDLVGKYRAQYPRVAELEEALRPKPGAGKATRLAGKGRRRSNGGGGGGGWDANADAIVSTFKAGNYDDALAMMDARKDHGGSRGLAIVRGWAQYHKGDWEGAKRTFSALEEKAPSGDSETGLRVIQQGYLPPAFR